MMCVKTFPFILLIVAAKTNCYCPFSSHQDVYCGNVISTIINKGDYLFYCFNISAGYNVNFDLCSSVADLQIVVFCNWDDISSKYCFNSDTCGSCFGKQNSYDNPAENFTIPMHPGVYGIGITVINNYANTYQMNISCNPILNYSNNSQTINILPNSSITQYDYIYYSNDIYSILSSQNLSNTVIINDSTLEIQFDIKLNNYCNKSLCNILFVGECDNLFSHHYQLMVIIIILKYYKQINIIFITNT
eukprot:273340_1